ncbi:MAG: HesA/MoeB/ThiF family protein [Bacteroidota bacterium]
MEKQHSYKRYQRQMILKEFGVRGQQKLQDAKVLVLGAGGLGCPALQYLGGAGIGTIGIVDDDVVSLTNLHRQVLFSTTDIGHSKALQAQHYLQSLNDEIIVEAFNERLGVHNALQIFSRYDIILDGSDNFATRYLVNDACVLLDKPFVYGAVSQFEGQVGILNVINLVGQPAVNYRDLFPHPPQESEVLNCAEGGVLGPLPGIIGTMQANEVIKFICGLGKPLVHSMLTFNALTNQVYTIDLTAREGSRSLIPADKAAFEKMDYAWLCGIKSPQQEIHYDQFKSLIDNSKVTIIDVREMEEVSLVNAFVHQKIPLSSMRKEVPAIADDTIVVFCQTGKRSMQAAQLLFDRFGTSKKIYSLHGGIENWAQHQEIT